MVTRQMITRLCKAGGKVGVCFFVALAGPAQAGGLKDEPVLDAAPMWSGFYVGALGSYLSAETDPRGFEFDGAMVGGTVGFNYQTGNVVLGVEADASFGELSDFRRDGNFLTFAGRFDNLVTLRARLGYAMGRWLPYVTGGVMWGQLDATSSCPDDAAIPDPIQTVCEDLVPTSNDNSIDGPFTVGGEETLFGWIAGVGVEHKIDDRWSVKAEVLTGDFDDETFSGEVPLKAGGTIPVSADTGLDLDVIGRFGINLTF